MPTKKPVGKKTTSNSEPTAEDIDKRLSQTFEHLAEIRKLWPELASLTDAQRIENRGAPVLGLRGPMTMLLDALRGSGVDDPEKTKREKLRSAFDTALGEDDGGEDSEHFEFARISDRVTLLYSLQQVSAEMQNVERIFRDTALSRAEALLLPTLRSLDLARTLARSNKTFASLLAPVMNELRARTDAARKATDQVEEPQETEKKNK